MKDRFLVDATSLAIGSEELSVKLSNYSNAEIIRIVYQIISDNWNKIKIIYEDRRRTYSALIDSLGVDRTKTVLAVDVGYKGSIHKKVSGLFENMIPIMLFLILMDTLNRPLISAIQSCIQTCIGVLKIVFSYHTICYLKR